MMPIIITREYHESTGEYFAVNDQIITDPKEVLLELHKLGVEITAAQMKFITSKHRMPKELYEKYHLQYDDLISNKPTMYPEDRSEVEIEPDQRQIDIAVDIYKSGNKIDHCEYIYKGQRYIRLSQLCIDLGAEGIELAPMQLRNCIHRGISSWVKFKYPNLVITTNELDF